LTDPFLQDDHFIFERWANEPLDKGIAHQVVPEPPHPGFPCRRDKKDSESTQPFGPNWQCIECTLVKMTPLFVVVGKESSKP
jgi:hypothetical protein